MRETCFIAAVRRAALIRAFGSFYIDERKESMSADIGWNAMEVTHELRKRDTFHNIRSEFILAVLLALLDLKELILLSFKQLMIRQSL